MEKAIANQRPTLEEIEFSKRMGTVDEARRRIINKGGFNMFQKIIDDPMFLGDILKFYREYVPSALGYADFLKWLRDNELEKQLRGGSLEKQIKWQEEIFYRRFYGKNFRIDRSRIFVLAKRLPAIKKGLEIGCVDKVLVVATPKHLSNIEMGMTEAEYVFHKLLKPTGIKIWAEEGRDRWTKRTLTEVLQEYVTVGPEDFNAKALEENWPKECLRVLTEIGLPATQRADKMELVITDSRQNIPHGQEVVNQKGESVNCDRRDFVTAVKNNIRIVTPEQEIILASQTFVESGKYLAIDTWEFVSALLRHEGVNPSVSVADADSRGSGLCLSSDGAGFSHGARRLRLAL